MKKREKEIIHSRRKLKSSIYINKKRKKIIFKKGTLKLFFDSNPKFSCSSVNVIFQYERCFAIILFYYDVRCYCCYQR